MINFENVSKLLLDSSLSETELIKEIKDISKLYTVRRKKISSFKWDERKVSAYTIFYMLTNMPKLTFLYNQLPKSVLEMLQNSTLIDFGAGPGTYTWQHLSYFSNFSNNTNFLETAKIIQIEREELMKSQSKVIQKNLFSQIDFSLSSKFELKRYNNKLTLLFGNSANEMSCENILTIIKQVNADQLIFIEPGTCETFQKLKNLRIDLIKYGYSFIFPCLESEKCPIALDENEWCHQVLKVTHEDKVERLAQILKLNRSVLPSIMWCLIRSENKDLYLDPFVKRATSFRFLSESKHCFLWQVCAELDDKKIHNTNRLTVFEISKRNLNKSKIKSLRKISTGIVFKYHILQKINKDLYRVELI